MRYTLVAVAGVLAGLLTPWDALPWNDAPSDPCRVVTFEDGSIGTADPAACRWTADTTSDRP